MSTQRPATTPTTTLSDQRQRLTQARDTLRATHLGLDTEIDRVLEAVAPWLLLNEAQQRPRVLGLWGMTGTGKSSLVRTLVQALGLAERTVWLDAGECRRGEWLEQHLELLSGHLDGGPLVFVVDEFQHARTVKGGTEQDESPELRRLWELIDAGRAVLMPGYRCLEELVDLHDQLMELLDTGALVRRGRVVRGVAAYRRIMAEHLEGTDRSERWALPTATWKWLRAQFGTTLSLNALRLRMERMDGPALLDMLQALITSARTPHVLDVRRALVIVLGNLDGLYVMGREPMAALEPDVLLARHRKLGTSGVQQALLQLFRIEQVARLGTDHVVFPPMGNDTVQALVQREVQALAARTGALMQVDVSVGQGVLERLHRNASIAVLGARPVVEAAQQVVPNLVTQVMLHPWAELLQAIHLEADGDRVQARLRFADGLRTMQLRWPGARTGPAPRAPELVRRIALHEAGHVLCGMRLMGLTPLQACAHAGQEAGGGFVVWAEDERPVTTAGIVPHLAMQLGGWAAELLEYGREGVSAGIYDDLEKATDFALSLAKEHGLGNDLRVHASSSEAPGIGFRLALADPEEQAARWIEAASELARRTLEQERALLGRIGDRLAQAGSLDRQALKALVHPVEAYAGAAFGPAA